MAKTFTPSISLILKKKNYINQITNEFIEKSTISSQFEHSLTKKPNMLHHFMCNHDIGLPSIIRSDICQSVRLLSISSEKF